MNPANASGLSVAAALFLAAAGAEACTCTERPEPKQALAEADAVFVGAVERIEVRTGPRQIRDWAVGRSLQYGGARNTLRVITVWKGPPDEFVSITTVPEGLCGYPFSVGETYLVYAQRRSGELVADICSRTNTEYKAEEDLQSLGPGTPVLKWDIPSSP